MVLPHRRAVPLAAPPPPNHSPSDWSPAAESLRGKSDGEVEMASMYVLSLRAGEVESSTSIDQPESDRKA